MVDYDLGRIVETAAWMEFRAEHLERARQLQLEERELDNSLTNGEARQEVLDTVVKAGISEEYARKALERLYPPEEKLRRLEKDFNVVESSNLTERKNKSLLRSYLRDLNQSLEIEGSGLELGILEKTPLQRFFGGYKNADGASICPVDEYSLNNLDSQYGHWEFYVSGKKIQFDLGLIGLTIYRPTVKKSLFSKETERRGETLAYLGGLAAKGGCLVRIKILSPEPLELIGKTLHRYPQIIPQIEKYYI